MSRKAKVQRKTKETDISIELDLDKASKREINTGIPFFDHILEQLSLHGRFGLVVQAKGDIEIDFHHLVEDVGIVLGSALKEALDERKGIKRYGSARVPMDETLISADVDLTTRAFLHYDLQPKRELVGDFDTSLPLEFWRAFTQNCGLNLHIEQVRGENAHHIIEASFKAVGRALNSAMQADDLEIVSSKGVL